MLEILFRDEHYVAVFKPAGMLVHRNAFDRTGPAVLQVLRNQLGRKVYPVHRLDRGTSGVLVLAFSAHACADLSRAFSERTVAKHYLAVVRGHAPDVGEIDRPIRQRETDVTQDALTQFETLARGAWSQPVGKYPEARFSLLRVQPHTGRRHQIRRHLRSLNHHLIGDTRWGDGRYNRYFREYFQSRQLLLTASVLGFPHPLTGLSISIKAPMDAEFKRLGRLFGWDDVLNGLATASSSQTSPGGP